MDQGYRALSLSSLPPTRDNNVSIMPMLTSELIEYSSFISTFQVLLSFEAFYTKICGTEPAPNKLSGKIKVRFT